ncbi:MAG: hypothetical protein LBJ71_00340 [Holosporaceae bacterium]|jgi:hypothetical protein|nr:hypothetical protein [Holosporaceae bacterium]
MKKNQYINRSKILFGAALTLLTIEQGSSMNLNNFDAIPRAHVTLSKNWGLRMTTATVIGGGLLYTASKVTVTTEQPICRLCQVLGKTALTVAAGRVLYPPLSELVGELGTCAIYNFIIRPPLLFFAL